MPQNWDCLNNAKIACRTCKAGQINYSPINNSSSIEPQMRTYGEHHPVAARTRIGLLLRRKQMGRPLNKRYMGDVAGAIKVTHSFNAFDGAETAGGEDTFIVSQRSSNKFLVSDTSDGWSEILTLVDKAAGSLAAGEFRVAADDADGVSGQVARFYNRTVRTTGPAKTPWAIDAPADQVITAITAATPGVVTVTSTADMVDGETVTLSGVVGMVEVNDNSYVATIIDATTFSIPDTNGFTAYTSDGVVSGIGNVGSVDIQAS